MAAPFPGWVLDPARNQYYYFSTDENAYIYQTGEKIYLNTPDPQPPSQPRHVPAVGGSRPRRERERGGDRDRDRGGERERRGDRDREREREQEDDPQDLAGTLEAMQIGGGRYTYGTAGFGAQEFFQTAPASEITDPSLANLGLQARGRLRGAPKDNEHLYPDYKRRRDATHFFVSGKVFKALWPELLGQANESVTITSETKFGEQIATKIRWFIVVKAGPHHCTCLPIVTYNRQGVAKKGVVKRHHAIAYTSSLEPQTERAERPSATEGDPMLPGIRVIPKNRRSKMDKMSRVDFSRMYTVEHNVKVFDFGNVHQSHLGRLQSQWIKVITDGGGAGTTGRLTDLDTGPSVGDHDDEPEEDDGEDDDQGDDGDDQGGYHPHPYYGGRQ